MSKHIAIQLQHFPASLTRIIARLVGVSLVSVGFGLAVLLIGWPLAASLWLAHEGVAWIARVNGQTHPLSEVLVSIVSTVAGLLLTAFLARMLFESVRRRIQRDRRVGAVRRRREQGTRPEPAGLPVHASDTAVARKASQSRDWAVPMA